MNNGDFADWWTQYYAMLGAGSARVALTDDADKNTKILQEAANAVAAGGGGSIEIAAGTHPFTQLEIPAGVVLRGQ